MYALIKNRVSGQVWTGDEWANPNQVGVLSAAKFASHEQASLELEQYEDENEFSNATVVDVPEESD